MTFSPTVHAQESVIKRLRLPLSGNLTVTRENNVEKLLVSNYLSSNILEINTDGSINSQSYSSFGATMGGDSLTDNQFTGHRKLDNLTVYHTGARFYSPTYAAFIQPDMVEGPNRYSYVGNNPVSFVDKDGNRKTSATGSLVKKIGEWIGSKIFGIATKEAPQEVSSSSLIKAVHDDLPAGAVIDLGKYGKPPGQGDAMRLVRDDEWFYNHDFRAEREGYTRLYRGVKPHAVSSELKPAATQEQFERFQQVVVNGTWNTNNWQNTASKFRISLRSIIPLLDSLPFSIRDGFIGERARLVADPVMSGGTDKYYTGWLEAARDKYAENGVVYYVDMPTDQLWDYQHMTTLLEDAYKIPQDKVLEMGCGIYCVGGKMIK